jgi:hypothetical protein
MRSNLIELMLCCCLAAAPSVTAADEQTQTNTTATFRLASTAKPSSCRASDFALDELRSREQELRAALDIALPLK